MQTHISWRKVQETPLKSQTLPCGRDYRSKERSDGKRKNLSELWDTFQFMSVQLCHRGWCPCQAVAAGVQRACGGACLSCCCCGCRSCMVMGRNWVGSHICRALWDSRWSCRRSSAGAASDRSWIFHLAASCFCLTSRMKQQRKEEEFNFPLLLLIVLCLTFYVDKWIFSKCVFSWQGTHICTAKKGVLSSVDFLKFFFHKRSNLFFSFFFCNMLFIMRNQRKVKIPPSP